MTLARQNLLIVLCILGIGGSILAIVSQLNQPEINVPLHRAVGQVMAEHTASLATNKTRVVIITLDSGEFPIVKAQMDGFEKTLKKFSHVEVDEVEIVKTEGKSKYGPGRGLSAERYLRIVGKNLQAGIFVSFIGAPRLDDAQIKKLPQPPPKLIAETRMREGLLELFEAKALMVAVVPRFIFPAPIEKPKTPRDWFDLYWQVINASTVPTDDDKTQ